MGTLASWPVGALAGAVLLSAGSAAAQAQAASPAPTPVKPGSESGFGLTGADVPPLLAAIKADPYKAPAAPVCDTVPAEIQAIDDLLGPDLDTPPAPDDSKKSMMSKGAGVARSLVPYGGVVRFVTGANKKDKELREAIMAGYARRGFLRGLESNLECHAEPPPETAPKHGRSKAAKPS